MEINPFYMRRAIELARLGLGNTSPNPMVGAVIVAPDGRIIGEGWHRKVGEAHAEVNAIAQVEDRKLLHDCTMYVTLEPCSHYGKTPPCAKLLVDCGVPRVVVGMTDPFDKVSGRGIAMLRDSGAEVMTGVLENECRALNPVFVKAHTMRRPWITLKWAQTADGFVDAKREDCTLPAMKISTYMTSVYVHRLRALHDAVMTGSNTVILDRPSLTTRLWPGRDARVVVADRRGRLGMRELGSLREPMVVGHDSDGSTDSMMRELYDKGITSVLVEGGPTLQQSLIDAGLYDAIRVETSPHRLNGAGMEAPVVRSHGAPSHTVFADGSRIDFYGESPWWMM